MELIKDDGRYFISSKELHAELGIRRDYSNWIKNSIQRAELEKDKDFTPKKVKSTGGRSGIDYLLTEDASIAVTMMSGGARAGQFRKLLINLFNKHKTGLAYTQEQLLALMDLSKAITLVSIQKEVERRHFNIYNDKYTWYQYRAGLLGYSTEDVIEAMKKVNKQHHSIRTSLVKLDANELIRVGVIDFMKVLGKTDEFAKNIGDTCKEIAKRMKLGNIIWDDIKENPLKINKSEINERLDAFDNANKYLDK